MRRKTTGILGSGTAILVLMFMLNQHAGHGGYGMDAFGTISITAFVIFVGIMVVAVVAAFVIAYRQK